MRARPRKGIRRNGLGVDASGGPVVDPTENVLQLVEAANKRQDDLRVETNRRLDAENRHVSEIAALRADHADSISTIRAQHAKEMSDAESARLNAIRQVDVSAVSTAAERSLAAIQTLATTTTANAENIRNAMTTTAAAVAQQLANTLVTITDRLSALEKSSYEGKGKSTVADPQMIELLAEMKILRGNQSAGKGQRDLVPWIIGGISALIAAGALLLK
jgi:hypothetical protein